MGKKQTRSRGIHYHIYKGAEQDRLRKQYDAGEQAWKALMALKIDEEQPLNRNDWNALEKWLRKD